MLTGRRPKSLSLSRSLGIFLTKSQVGSAQRKANYRQHFLLWLNLLRQRIEKGLWAKRIEHCPDPEFSVGQFQGRSKAFELLLISFKALHTLYWVKCPISKLSYVHRSLSCPSFQWNIFDHLDSGIFVASSKIYPERNDCEIKQYIVINVCIPKKHIRIYLL